MMYASLVGPVFCAILGLLAFLRARQLRDEHAEARCSVELALGLTLAVVAVVFFVRTTALDQVGFAFVAVCAYSDMTQRRIYLPVVVGAIAAAVPFAVISGMLVQFALGAVIVGSIAYVLHLAAGERGFAFGDVLFCAVVGACFGPWVAGMSIAIGLVIGAVVAVAMVALHVCSRRYEWPMAAFLALGVAGEFVVRGGV